MTDFDLAGLQAAAAADPRPKASTPNEIPTGTSPPTKPSPAMPWPSIWSPKPPSLTAMPIGVAVNASTPPRSHDSKSKAALPIPQLIDKLNAEWVRATLNARYCAELHTIAQAGYERIFELMGPRQAGTTRTEILERMAATVDEINALTQRLIDEYRPGDSVYEFLSARTLDTTVPQY